VITGSLSHRAGCHETSAGETEGLVLLECDGVSKEYGGLTVLDGVTLTLPPRGLFGLCGPNGAGKSTLLGIIGGSVPAARGRILLDGEDVTRLPQQRFGLGVSRTFQAVHLIGGRTVLDNVAVACLTSHRSGLVTRLFRSELAAARQRAAQTLDRLGMTALSGRDVSSLTLESQRMVELARAIAPEPRLLLLDEPASGLSDAGATDVTPQVLAMLAAKPQIILFGLVPGTDSITAIRAIRAQDADIPISECSACELPSFAVAAGGASVMHNIYILGSMQSWLNAASKGSSAQARPTAAGHLNINTLGIVWSRTPDNYENIAQVLAAMEVIGSDGAVSLYDGTK
jgi:ABC-type branched-subunit amino acid transport system ATPase component